MCGLRVQQTFVVALVQTDRGLVEDIAHADQPAAELRRQANTLGLTAGERRAAPVERQVAQPHAVHEVQPLADLTQDRVGYVLGLARETQLVKEPAGRTDRQPHDVVDVVPGIIGTNWPVFEPMRTASASGRSRAP